MITEKKTRVARRTGPPSTLVSSTKKLMSSFNSSLKRNALSSVTKESLKSPAGWKELSVCTIKIG